MIYSSDASVQKEPDKRLTILPMIVVLFTLVTMGARPAPVQGEDQRIALVIGVSGYRHLTPLPNPANDARAMARALTTAGFDLVGGGPRIDPDRRELEAAIEAFTAR